MDKRIVMILKNPFRLFMTFGHRGWFNWIGDEKYLKIAYRIAMGKKLPLDNPQTFCEKLQWLKIYDRKPEYTMMVDKYEAKKYVAEIIGEEHVIPTIGIWDRFEDIDFDSLPNRFVLKCTHDSGGLIICKDKSKLNKKKAKSLLNGCLKNNYYWGSREWPYKNVPRRILAEKYIDPVPNVKDLPDYKWYCFNGEPKYCQVIQNRTTNETIDFFDTEWKHQGFVGLNPNVGNAKIPPVKPANIETHLRITRLLSDGLPFSRIDLYESGNHTYFGEITFYPMSGMGVFKPDQYNEILGRMIVLPCEKHG